jgi:FlaA1/EpsC-like NDP-sugar epimerase
MLVDFRREMLVRMMRLLDLAVLCTVFLACLAMSSGSFSWASFSEILLIRIAIHNLISFAAYLVFCSAVFAACGLYASHRLSHWHRRLQEIVLAVMMITVVLLVMRWLFQFKFATNLFLLLFCLLNVLGLFVARESIRVALHFVRLRGRNLRNIVLIGEEPNATALAQRLRQEASLGYQVLQVIDAKEMAEWSNRN